MNAAALQRVTGCAAGGLIGKKTEHHAARASHGCGFGTVQQECMLDFFDAVPLLALKRLLKDVAHVCTERVRVAALDGGEHGVRIRTVGDRYTVYAREERGCGDREVRLADGDEEARCGLEDGQLFAAALGLFPQIVRKCLVPCL